MTMSGLTKLLFLMMMTAGLFLLASGVLFFFPELGLSTWSLPFSIAAAILGTLTGIIGSAASLDRPKLF
jgi:Na+/H+ antiporter NhaB